MAFKETIQHMASGKESLYGGRAGIGTMHAGGGLGGKEGKQYVEAFQM